MNVQRNIEMRSCTHCCSGKATGITQPECVFLAFGILHAMRVRYIITRGLLRSTKSFHFFHKRLAFRKQVTEQKQVF